MSSIRVLTRSAKTFAAPMAVMAEVWSAVLIAVSPNEIVRLLSVEMDSLNELIESDSSLLKEEGRDTDAKGRVSVGS